MTTTPDVGMGGTHVVMMSTVTKAATSVVTKSIGKCVCHHVILCHVCLSVCLSVCASLVPSWMETTISYIFIHVVLFDISY